MGGSRRREGRSGETSGAVGARTAWGWCPDCGRPVDARYREDGGRVYLVRDCPTHGSRRTLVAESARWLREAERREIAPRRPPRARDSEGAGCPADCGPCAGHRQRCTLAVLFVTGACDLACPKCFVFDRSERVSFVSPAELRRQLDFLIDATGGVALLNVTGGEPTLHPELLGLLEATRRPGIGRVSVNTNGLRLARDPEMCRRLAELDVDVVLSLDALDPAIARRLHGRDVSADKMRALDHLERAGVRTSLLMVLAGGVNESQIAPLLAMTLERDVLRGLYVQTMTYCGERGRAFAPRRRLPLDAAEAMIERAGAGRIAQASFLPLPTAHPLCYGASYLLRDEAGGFHPLSEILGAETLSRLLRDSHLLQPTAGLEAEMRLAIDRIWSEGGRPALLRALKAMLLDLFPAAPLSHEERRRRAERWCKAIYVHAYMDEDTWEHGRATRCPHQVVVEGERLVCACHFNLFHRAGAARRAVAPAR